METKCFESDEESYDENLAKASGLRDAADRMHGSNSKLACIALKEAAEIYETIGKPESAAKCFFELKEFKRAGMLYLERCGEARLEDAGDCFALAGCWSTAAEVYSRANCFSKCLAVCTTGNIFDVGLHLVEYWKEGANADVDITKIQELKEMKQGFLERCAVHYHELNDTSNMMKFVRTFNSMDVRRTFLRSRDYLDELVLIEAESGNFMEAARIARLKGYVLLEVDMLEKAGRYEEASRIILLYVLGNSLWEIGSKGWPLKKFTNKEELLIKAKLMANNISDLFYEFVCVEARSLSDKFSSLSQMGDCLTASKSVKNIRAEIISSRRILDCHLNIAPPEYDWEENVVLNPKENAEQSISRNRVSVETLIYFWNLWKEKIVNILKYLNSLGTEYEKDYKSYEEFCLGYLGVSKQEHNQNSIYLLLHSDAYWKREIDDRSLQKNGDLVNMDVHQLVSAARSYWVSEVISVCMDVLEKLETLHKLSCRSSVSIFHQGTTVLHIYEVTKWLMVSNILDRKLPCALQKYLTSSRENFFEIVCLTDSKLITMENMIDLRRTELSKDLFEEIIIEIINTKGKLSPGKIGKVVMLIFVSGSLSDELYQQITKCSDLSPRWKFFIEQLTEYVHSGQITLSLACRFQAALQESFNENWKKECNYSSPFCYVYLLERLHFLVSSCQLLFFTTKSTLMETLSSENWKCNSETIPKSDFNALVGCFGDFMVGMIEQIFSSKETLQWLEKTDIAAKKNNPLLILRLFILIWLVCMNTGEHFGLVNDLLHREDISSLLPQTFREKLVSPKKLPNERVLAKALRAIDNPLVILFSGNNRPKFSCPDAIFIDMDLIKCREDILGILFPKNRKCIQKDTMIQLVTKHPSGVTVSLCRTDHGSSVEHPRRTDLPDEEKQYLEIESENEICDMQRSYKQFWNTFDVPQIEAPEKSGEATMIIASNRPQTKLKVEESSRVLDAAIIKLNKSGPSGDEDCSLSSEAENMLGELKQLCAALSDKRLECNISNDCKVLNKLQARESRMKPLDSLFSCNDTNTPTESSQANVSWEGKSNSNNKNNQGKENPKSKKGKKGKGGRK